jgi:capsular polysaccharide transport system ATP-binding protein
MITFERAGRAYRNRKGEIGWVLRDFSYDFAPGISTGILAPRGQGKSTFISLAAGNEMLTEGRIYREGRISQPYGARSHISNKLTGKQNLRFMTDVYGRNFGRAYEFVTEFADLGRYLDAPMRQYNFEMRARLAVSMLFALEFDYILIDDALDGGDMNFRRKCAQYIEDNRSRFTLLIATSNPLMVTKYCQRAGVLNEGQLTFYPTVEDAVERFNAINQVLV